MSSNCCVSVPPDSGYRAFATALPAWQAQLTSGLNRSVQASDQSLGHLEEHIARQTRAVERTLLEEAAQKKADLAPPLCPVCGHKLTRRTHGHARTLATRAPWPRAHLGHALWRHHAAPHPGLVPPLPVLFFPGRPCAGSGRERRRLAGRAGGGRAPGQPDAGGHGGRGAGTAHRLGRAAGTLDRLARRQGKRAEEKRARLDEQMRAGAGAAQLGPAPPEAFTLVIEIDAWHIRERDAWGQAEALRSQGREPEHWHWVYGGTCFRLDQRTGPEGGRAVIASRGYVMTRGGVDALREQLHAEALRHHLGRAGRVLLVADGAAWIWNLGADRFPQAVQRLDYFHAAQQLWTVARALHPADEAGARAWVEPLLKKLKAGQGVRVIEDLRGVLQRVRRAQRAAVASGLGYLETHRTRLDYDQARQRGEPLGSGAMESTCRQYQCRFKRPGQFWSRAGDEALMCLETFRRNGRWSLLFPHSAPTDPSKN